LLQDIGLEELQNNEEFRLAYYKIFIGSTKDIISSLLDATKDFIYSFSDKANLFKKLRKIQVEKPNILKTNFRIKELLDGNLFDQYKSFVKDVWKEIQKNKYGPL
jgi:hypothetical protein